MLRLCITFYTNPHFVGCSAIIYVFCLHFRDISLWFRCFLTYFIWFFICRINVLVYYILFAPFDIVC